MEKTVKIKVRVAVWQDGSYVAYGDDLHPEKTFNELMYFFPKGETLFWVEADLPLTQTPIKGIVLTNHFEVEGRKGYNPVWCPMTNNDGVICQWTNLEELLKDAKHYEWDDYRIISFKDGKSKIIFTTIPTATTDLTRE